MTSTSTFSTRSPISKVPHDVLLEIFAHCLPQYPLYHLQPNPTIAPILLCHVCPSWRTIVLATPTLWAYLSHRVRIVGDFGTDSTSSAITFDERDIEYIRWWRGRQGSVKPFLSFKMWFDDDSDMQDMDYLDHEMTGDEMDFLLEYISSAQHLELDNFFWIQVHLKIAAGYQVAFPNLHTLIFEPEWLPDGHPFYHAQSLIPAQAQSALRRLSIHDDEIPDLFGLLNHWSTLTHFFLSLSDISIKCWFSIIREVPGLRWAYFRFTTLVGTTDYTPTQYILPRLTTLSIAVHNGRIDDPVVPLSLLFAGLHLPSLRNLALSSPSAKEWEDHRAITELYSVLESTPAITNLVLGDNFLNLGVHTTAALLAGMEAQGPVWNRAAQLTHLQLDVPIAVSITTAGRQEAVLESFVDNILSPENIWLNLQSPLCPIRTVTFAVKTSDGVFDRVMREIRKSSHKTPGTMFQVTSDSASHIANAVRNEWRALN